MIAPIVTPRVIQTFLLYTCLAYFYAHFIRPCPHILTVLPNRHLSDPSHRETYESAHSVILAIFAAHAQRQQQHLAGDNSSGLLRNVSKNPVSSTANKAKYLTDQQCKVSLLSAAMKCDNEIKTKNVGTGREGSVRQPITDHEAVVSATFVQRMVPFYSRCLIEVSSRRPAFVVFVAYRHDYVLGCICVQLILYPRKRCETLRIPRIRQLPNFKPFRC